MKSDQIEQLSTAVETKSTKSLMQMGGLPAVARLFNSNTTTGLTPDLIAKNRDEFGTNSLPEPTMKYFYQFVLEAFNDKTLKVLIAAAIVELALGVYKFKFAPASEREETALLDGGAILAAGNSSIG